MVNSTAEALTLLADPDPYQRREAAIYLAQHPITSETGEALIAALGDSNAAAQEAIISAIVAHAHPGIVSQLVRVLKESRPERRNAALSALTAISQQTPEIAIAALTHPTLEVRQWATEALGELNEPQSVPGLIDRLNDGGESPNVRRAAAQALGKLGDPGATPALIKAATQSDFWLRHAAIEALSRLADERAAGPLVDMMKTDVWTRPIIIKALGNIGSGEAVPDLVAMLDDSNEAVRTYTLEALLKIVIEPFGRRTGTPLTARLRPLIPVEPLQRELKSHTAPNSAYAANLLGWLARPEALPDLIEALDSSDESLRDAAMEAVLRHGEAALPTLMTAIDRPQAALRERVAELLGLLGNPLAVPALLRHLTDGHLPARQAVLRALGALGGEAAYGGLLQALTDPATRETALGVISQITDDAQITDLKSYLQRYLYEGQSEGSTRWSAAQALSLLGDEMAVSILLNAMRLPDEAIRQPAAEALARVQGRRAVNVLIEALGDRDWLVRQKAVEALSRIPDSRVITALLPLAHDSEWRVRLALVNALGRINDNRVYLLLQELEHDADPWVRRRVAEVCGRLDDARAGDILRRCLRDPDLRVRQVAALAVRWKRDATLVPGMIELLSDENAGVRRTAVRALAAVLGQSAIDVLMPLAHDLDEGVRFALADMLGEIGSDEALPLLDHLLADAEERVRRQVVESLAHIGTLSALNLLADALANPVVKAEAQAQLHTLGDQALRALLNAARSSAPELRIGAAETLGQMGNPLALPTLHNMHRDPDARVRQAAEAAIQKISPA